MKNPLQLIFFLTLALVAVNTVFFFLKKYSLIRYTGFAASIAALSGYICILMLYGHIPASGDTERYITIVFILTTIGNAFLLRDKSSPRTYLYWPLSLLYLLYVLTGPIEAGKDYFMYHNQWVICFFHLRIISLALISYAFTACISSLKEKEKTRSALLQRTRNFTLLGAVIFLAGEFCGSYWSWIGWGDPWRWSKNFFLATSMFLLAVVTSHLPSSVMISEKKRAWYTSVLLFIILIIYNL